MAVTNQLTTIHSCEQATDAVTGCVMDEGASGTYLSGGGEYVEGTCGYGFDLDIETLTEIFTPSSSLDLTSQVLWVWLRLLTPDFLDTWANGGVVVRLSDGTNYSEWYIGGSGRWGSSWVRVPVYLGSTPDAISGTLNLAAVTTIEFDFTAVTKSKLPENVFIDFLQYGAVGSGIKVTGGSLGMEENWSDVEADDITAAVGMIEEVNGIYYLNGPITFGDTATNSIYFEDLNQILVTRSHYRTFTTGNRGTAESLVASTHYKIKVQNYSGGTCNFQLGEAQGGRGVSGCIFKNGSNRKLSFDFNDTDIDLLKLYACTFIDCGTFGFPTAISGSEVSDSTWNGCGEVTVSTFKFRYCNVVNATGYGVIIASALFDVQSSNFINPTSAGIQFTTATTYAFVGMNFVGTGGSGPYDIDNATVSAIIVQNDANSNAGHASSSGGGAVSFESTVNLKVTVKDLSGSGITGVRLLLEADAGGNAPHEESVTITRVTSIATVSHTAHGLSTGQYIIIRGANQQEYNGVYAITKIDDNSYSYTVSGTPATPATGTIKATQAFMSELTIAGGIAEESFNYGSSQPYTGVARKASGTPYYRDASFSGTIGSGGIDIPVQLELDE